MLDPIRIPTLVLLTIATCSAAWSDGMERARVAVVFGSHSYRQATADEAALVRVFADSVKGALDAVGIAHDSLDDSDVESGRLAGYDVAIFPYNFIVPQAETDAIESYVGSGGKLLVFYSIEARVAALLGFDIGPRVGGDFRRVRLDAGRLEGLPESIEQHSWNIRRVTPDRSDARVLGEWVGADGESLHEPALLISADGAYMGHVLTAGDVGNKGRMLKAILSHFAPEVNRGAGRRACAGASAELDRLEGRLQRVGPGSENRERAGNLLSDARQQLAQARDLAARGRDPEAVAAALHVRQTAEPAYHLCARERREEFRGVWIHDAYGVPGWGWDRTIRHLRDSGFNGIMANMLRAGLAHYPSQYLPTSSKVRDHGDQIAECLRWADEYGVELHVWKVNLNLEGAPPDFVNKLRQQGRLQQHLDGSEIEWLCPSDPRNFALERDSMLEVVRKYDVAGIHLDYIRYPHEEACFCDGCRERFERDAGVIVSDWPRGVLQGPSREQFAQWRRDQITKLVRVVSTEARRIRPGIMVSAAVFSWPDSRDWAGQDWKQWIDEGLLDFVCPMNYTPSTELFESLVDQQVQTVGGKVPLYPGIGEFIISDPRVLMDQVESARRLGADGFVCFSYEHAASAGDHLPTLHASLTANPAGPLPHLAPHAEFDFPRPAADGPRLAYLAEVEMQVQVTLTREGRYPAPIARAEGVLRIESTDGEPIRVLGPISSESSAPVKVRFTLQPGHYRLVVSGTVSFYSSEEREFVARSQPFEVLPPPAVSGSASVRMSNRDARPLHSL